MSYLNTLRQILTLIFATFAFIALMHGCANYLGKSFIYSQLNHPVLEKINSSIYLKPKGGSFVFENAAERADLPQQILEMKWIELIELSDLDKIPLEGCVFFEVKKDLDDWTLPENINDKLSNNSCVFFNSPWPSHKHYISRYFPRWFYNIGTVDLQKSRFFNSLMLASLAPLEGDFIVIEEPKSSFPKELLQEIERRKIIIFFKADKDH